MNIIPASAWGRAMKSNAPRMRHADINEMTVHYTGASRVNTGREQIAARIKTTERYHMSRDKNMSGIGYNFAIDKWGRIWELRGWTFQNAANGTNSNRTSFSVVCLVGVEDNALNNEMIKSLQWLYGEARRRFNRVLIIKGHQEHKATACPGSAIMALIRSGRIQESVAPDPPITKPLAPAPAPPTNERSYTVVRNDSYWGIAQKLLGRGNRWMEISQMNNNAALRPGMVIRVPRF
jgi:LysM repeat protein